MLIFSQEIKKYETFGSGICSSVSLKSYQIEQNQLHSDCASVFNYQLPNLSNINWKYQLTGFLVEDRKTYESLVQHSLKCDIGYH